MGELIVLGVLLWWLFSAMSKSKKKPKAAQPTAPVPAETKDLLVDDEDDEDDEDEYAEDAEQLTMLDEPTLLEEPAAPAPQTVLTAEGVGTGRSMQASAPGGIDPCHPGEAAMLRPAARSMQPEERMQPVQAKEGFEPDFSPEAMRQAVVMSEILTRPCERRRRRYYP